jgi:host factor-I protein
MAEFQTGSPSVRQIQGFIKDKKEVEAKLTTGDVIAGRVAWQDQDCLCFRVSGQDMIVWRASLVYIKLRA